MKIYFTFDPRPDLKESLTADFQDVQFVFEKRVSTEHLVDCDILVTYGEDLTDEHIAAAQKLEWIFVASAGVEKMPAQAIADRGIYVSNVRGIHKKPMAESILAHILAIKRNLPAIYKKQKERAWGRHKIKFSELNGSTALILGPGAIGQEIGRILQAFEVHTIGCNTSGEAVSYMNETVRMAELESVLGEADIIISMLPSTEKTRGLITAEHFKLMKESAIFMNFGRGDLVSNEVIIEAVENDEIGYVVLDVFEEEPLAEDSPLWGFENVIVSPHVSSHSSRYLERSFDIFKPSLREWMKGERRLQNEVDLLRGY